MRSVAKKRKSNGQVLAHMLFSFLCLGLLAACNGGDDVAHDQFAPTFDGACTEAAMKKEFLVRWKDGTVTVEHAESQADFVENFLIPNEEDIEITEHNFAVALDIAKKREVNALEATLLDVNWGQNEIEATTAWANGHKGSGVVVAVIDTGADLDHPQLVGQFYENEAEKNGVDGVDDDGNGFIDDVSGWNFVDDIPEADDDEDHGTHVTGIIAAKHDVGTVDIKGVAPEAKVLPLKFLSSNGRGSLDKAIEAIDYAVSRGAKVINASWGGGDCSTVLQTKIAELEGEGILFMAAAGNDSSDIGTFPEYPAAFDLAAQLTIGAMNFSGNLAGFSNFSDSLVDLLAPGQDVTSLVRDNKVKALDGTSMATPFVSATAAILWGAKPSASAAEVKNAILNSVANENFEVLTGGHVNVKLALDAL